MSLPTDVASYPVSFSTMKKFKSLYPEEINGQRAKQQPNAAPAAILQEALKHIQDEEVLINLSERMVLIRNINRHQNRRRPNLPQLLEDVEIVHPYDETIHGERFFQIDSGGRDENRILIFSDRRSLEWLARSNIIFSDGTFKTVPYQFYQLYTLHGSVFRHVFPLIYCLTARKIWTTQNNGT